MITCYVINLVSWKLSDEVSVCEAFVAQHFSVVLKEVSETLFHYLLLLCSEGSHSCRPFCTSLEQLHSSGEPNPLCLQFFLLWLSPALADISETLQVPMWLVYTLPTCMLVPKHCLAALCSVHLNIARNAQSSNRLLSPIARLREGWEQARAVYEMEDGSFWEVLLPFSVDGLGFSVVVLCCPAVTSNSTAPSPGFNQPEHGHSKYMFFHSCLHR